MKQRILFGLAWLISSWACAELRLGLWSESSQRELADLLTTQLAADPQITLLERDDLNKILDEKALQRLMAGNATVTPLQLPGVEALLFLSRVEETTGPRARLVSVRHGLVLMDVILPPDLTRPEQATAIRARIQPLKGKIDSPKKNGLAVAILNIRSSLGDPEWKTLESTVTILLESRLAAEPSIIVLDRRTLGQLSQEKELNRENTPFPAGLWLLDGSLEPQSTLGTRLQLTLYMRRQFPATTHKLSLTGTKNQLELLVQQAVTELFRKIDLTSAVEVWDPIVEARQHAEEAGWAWRRSQRELTLSSIQAAEALGLRSPDLSALRVEVMASELGGWNYDTDDEVPRKIPLTELRHRCSVWQEARAESDRYLALGGENGSVRGVITGAGLMILRQSVETEGWQSAAELRKGLRQRMGFEPRLGKIPKDWSVVYSFAPYLAEDADELILYYKGILTATKPEERFRANGALRRLRQQQDRSIPTFLEPDDRRRGAIWNQFLSDLGADPVLRWMPLLVSLGREQEADKLFPGMKRLFDQLEQDQEQLWASGWFPYAMRATNEINGEVVLRLKSERSRLLLYYLQHASIHDEISFEHLWKPELLAAEYAPKIWHDFLLYRERVTAAARTESKETQNDLSRNLKYSMERLVEAFPSVMKTASPSVKISVPVTKYWDLTTLRPDLSSSSYPKISGLRIVMPLRLPSGEGALGVIQLPSLVAELIPCPVEAYDVVLSEESAYPIPGLPAGVTECVLARYDWKTKNWTQQKIPAYHHQYNLAWGNKIYLNRFDGKESTLMRYDGNGQTLTILASSRRRPRQNQFDDCDNYFGAHFFAGPGGSICSLIHGQPYLLQDKPGDWPPLFPVIKDSGEHSRYSEPGFWQFAGQDQMTVLRSLRGDVVLIDPQKPDPIPVLVSEATGALLPAWSKAAWGRPTPMEDANDYNDLFMAANRRGLFSIHRASPEMGSYYYLRWLQPGGPFGGEIIRLNFIDPPSITTVNRARESINGVSVLRKPILKISDHGLIFALHGAGFYFLPFTDLTAALERKPLPLSSP